jgi:septal ring factor EnvC (AmiA/AmiB activator)
LEKARCAESSEEKHMRLISAMLLFMVLSPVALPAVQQPPKSGDGRAAAASAQNDIQELRQDIQKMKSLVQQMETNLAFVDTTPSPLKHQFQLEIDMWKALIERMERRLDSMKQR